MGKESEIGKENEKSYGVNKIHYGLRESQS